VVVGEYLTWTCISFCSKSAFSNWLKYSDDWKEMLPFNKFIN
jgi:hypothetical protein